MKLKVFRITNVKGKERGKMNIDTSEDVSVSQILCMHFHVVTVDFDQFL